MTGPVTPIVVRLVEQERSSKSNITSMMKDKDKEMWENFDKFNHRMNEKTKVPVVQPAPKTCCAASGLSAEGEDEGVSESPKRSLPMK